MFSRVEPMQERCGATGWPASAMSRQTAKVRSRVEPPAPKVTEKKSGWSAASWLRTARNFSSPSPVCGGKNSMESCMGVMWIGNQRSRGKDQRLPSRAPVSTQETTL